MRNFVGPIFAFGGFLAATLMAAEGPPRANQLREDHLPTPFSAAEIRAASPNGYTTRHLVVRPGRPAELSVNIFDGDDAEVARFRAYTADPSGEPVAEPQLGEAKWTELQAHASFPAARTTVKPAQVEVAAGSFACWLYTVTGQVPVENGPPREVVSRFWFARDLPGPPVKMVQTVDGAETMVMEL